MGEVKTVGMVWVASVALPSAPRIVTVGREAILPKYLSACFNRGQLSVFGTWKYVLLDRRPPKRRWELTWVSGWLGVFVDGLVDERSVVRSVGSSVNQTLVKFYEIFWWACEPSPVGHGAQKGPCA